MTARFCTRLIALVVVSGVASAQTPTRADLTRDLDRLSKIENIANVPPADSVLAGARMIPVGSIYRGTIVARGPVDVSGRVEGSVVSLTGDVTVHNGAVVTGDALSVGGRVIADSGIVHGEIRTMATLPTIVPGAAAAITNRTAAERTANSLRLVCGFFVILLVIAVGVVLFAGRNLDEVVGTLETRFANAFWYGLLGQIAALPVLAVLIVALTLSLVGILLIPFAIVAYAVAVAGLVTLGFLATARLIGGAVYKNSGVSPKGRTMIALAIGVAVFFALWLIAAALTWAPLAASVVGAAALSATWVAMTLGLGAALISRAGTHRKTVAARARTVELASWQTPTPVTGVVAARRAGGTREVH